MASFEISYPPIQRNAYTTPNFDLHSKIFGIRFMVSMLAARIQQEEKWLPLFLPHPAFVPLEIEKK